jgi:hypothetical protein
MEKVYTYPAIDRLMWAFVAAGAGIVLLLLGLGLPAFVPQEGSVSATRWLEVLTSRPATGQPTFNLLLTRAIFVILGIFALTNAWLIYRIGSVTIKIDDDVIIYQRGDKTTRVPWTEVTDVKKRKTVGVRAGATELVTIATETDSHKITFNSKITGYDEILKAIQTHTNVKF